LPIAVWYNFVRIHKSLTTTTAMQAGISDRLWSMADVVQLIDEYEPHYGGVVMDRVFVLHHVRRDEESEGS
jgi:hypothetical protein